MFCDRVTVKQLFFKLRGQLIFEEIPLIKVFITFDKHGHYIMHISRDIKLKFLSITNKGKKAVLSIQ